MTVIWILILPHLMSFSLNPRQILAIRTNWELLSILTIQIYYVNLILLLKSGIYPILLMWRITIFGWYWNNSHFWYLHYSVKLHFHFYGMKHPPAWEDLHSSHSDGRFYIYHVLRSKLAISLIIAIKPPSINIFTLSKFPFTDFIPQPIFCILTTIQY